MLIVDSKQHGRWSLSSVSGYKKLLAEFNIEVSNKNHHTTQIKEVKIIKIHTFIDNYKLFIGKFFSITIDGIKVQSMKNYDCYQGLIEFTVRCNDQMVIL